MLAVCKSIYRPRLFMGCFPGCFAELLCCVGNLFVTLVHFASCILTFWLERRKLRSAVSKWTSFYLPTHPRTPTHFLSSQPSKIMANGRGCCGMVLQIPLPKPPPYCALTFLWYWKDIGGTNEGRQSGNITENIRSGRKIVDLGKSKCGPQAVSYSRQICSRNYMRIENVDLVIHWLIYKVTDPLTLSDS